MVSFRFKGDLPVFDVVIQLAGHRSRKVGLKRPGCSDGGVEDRADGRVWRVSLKRNDVAAAWSC